jgi:hypothetical protein
MTTQSLQLEQDALRAEVRRLAELRERFRRQDEDAPASTIIGRIGCDLDIAISSLERDVSALARCAGPDQAAGPR